MSIRGMREPGWRLTAGGVESERDMNSALFLEYIPSYRRWKVGFAKSPSGWAAPAARGWGEGEGSVPD